MDGAMNIETTASSARKNPLFQWVCLGVAVVGLGLLGWMINDLRLELKSSASIVNEKLPEILENTKKSTDTLAQLSDDIKQLRDLAGISDQTRDRSLVAFADNMLDAIEASGGKIALNKKFFGSGLKDIIDAKEWVVAARKEALLQTFRSKSKAELLDRLCKNKYGSDWMFQSGDSEALSLFDWLKQNHPDAKAVAAEIEASDDTDQ